MKRIWQTLIGPVVVTTNDLGITNIGFGSPDELAELKPVSKETAKMLDAQMHNEPTSIKLDLHTLAPFRQMAIAKLLEIPHGEVRSYAWVAREVGNASAIRAVASACSGNPIPLIIPCHRVVRSDGTISKYSLGGPGNKEKLLISEGVDVARLLHLAKKHVRFIGLPEEKTFHLVSCKVAVAADASEKQLIEMRTDDEAKEALLTPCKRCRPVHLY